MSDDTTHRDTPATRHERPDSVGALLLAPAVLEHLAIRLEVASTAWRDAERLHLIALQGVAGSAVSESLVPQLTRRSSLVTNGSMAEPGFADALTAVADVVDRIAVHGLLVAIAHDHARGRWSCLAQRAP